MYKHCVIGDMFSHPYTNMQIISKYWFLCDMYLHNWLIHSSAYMKVIDVTGWLSQTTISRRILSGPLDFEIESPVLEIHWWYLVHSFITGWSTESQYPFRDQLLLDLLRGHKSSTSKYSHVWYQIEGIDEYFNSRWLNWVSLTSCPEPRP